MRAPCRVKTTFILKLAVREIRSVSTAYWIGQRVLGYGPFGPAVARSPRFDGGLPSPASWRWCRSPRVSQRTEMNANRRTIDRIRSVREFWGIKVPATLVPARASTAIRMLPWDPLQSHT
jgi:hypothetical protein